jgi:hypothetical protein
MKQYVIDELRPEDYQKLKAHLDSHYAVDGFGGLYWLPLDEKEYDGFQIHHEECGPYYFALELAPERLACELLVRTNKRVRCDCICYATERQRNWLIHTVDAICERIGIIV